MIWPWSRFQRDREIVDTQAAMIDRLQDQLADERKEHQLDLLSATHAAEVAAIHLRTSERDLELAQTEAHSLKQDLRHLSASLAAKNDRKYGPITGLDRDPFAEDPTIPSTWLTDDSTLPDFERAEELLNSGEGEDGFGRGSSTGPGPEGASQ